MYRGKGLTREMDSIDSEAFFHKLRFNYRLTITVDGETGGCMKLSQFVVKLSRFLLFIVSKLLLVLGFNIGISLMRQVKRS